MWAIYFVLVLTSYVVMGGAFGAHQGGATLHAAAVTLYVGEGPLGNNGACLPVFSHVPRYPQANGAPLVPIPEWVGLCTL